MKRNFRQSPPEQGQKDHQQAGAEHPSWDEDEARRADRATGPSSACQQERGACQWSDEARHRGAREGVPQGAGQRERTPQVRQSGDEVGRHALREAGFDEEHRRVQGDRGGRHARHEEGPSQACQWGRGGRRSLDGVGHRVAHGAGRPGGDQWAGCPMGGHGEGRGLGATGPWVAFQWGLGAFQWSDGAERREGHEGGSQEAGRMGHDQQEHQ